MFILQPTLCPQAARTALALHQWITEPDFDREGDVQAAERHLAAALPGGLLGAAEGVWSWLQGGGTRPPIRAALMRYWRKCRLLRVPVPLTGPRALRADAPEGHADWVVAFLEAVAAEAGDHLELLSPTSSFSRIKLCYFNEIVLPLVTMGGLCPCVFWDDDVWGDAAVSIDLLDVWVGSCGLSDA